MGLIDLLRDFSLPYLHVRYCIRGRHQLNSYRQSSCGPGGSPGCLQRARWPDQVIGFAQVIILLLLLYYLPGRPVSPVKESRRDETRRE